MAKNLRWKLLTILVVLGLSAWAFIPPQEKVRLGLDLKGGVHLVMRVQTDDALRVETEATADRLRETLRTQNIAVGGVTVAGRQRVPRRRACRRRRTPQFRQRAGRRRPDVRPRRSRAPTTPSGSSPTSSTSSARRRSTRRCRPSSAGSTSSASPSRWSPATAATTRSWCSCPASPTSTAPRRSSGRRRCSSSSWSSRGRSPTRPSARQALRRQRAARHPDPARPERGHRRRAADHRLLRGAPRRRRDRPRPAQRPADARREQPPGGQLLAEQPRARAKFGTFTQANINRQLGHRARRPRLLGAQHPVAHRRRGPHHRQLHPAGGRRPRR